MKRTRLLLTAGGIAALTLLLSSCGQQAPAAARGKHRVLPSVQLVQKGGKFCAPDSGLPFTGTVQLYLENGNPAGEEHYADGLPHGAWKRFYTNSAVVREEKTWDHGNLKRKREWFPGGALREETPLENGEPVGWQRMWWEDGRIRRSSYMLPGFVPHGHRLEYAEDGSVIWDAVFDNGVFVSGTGPAEAIEVLRTQQAGMKPPWMTAAATGAAPEQSGPAH